MVEECFLCHQPFLTEADSYSLIQTKSGLKTSHISCGAKYYKLKPDGITRNAVNILSSFNEYRDASDKG